MTNWSLTGSFLCPDRGFKYMFNFERMLRKKDSKLVQKHMDTHLFWTDWNNQAEIIKNTLTPSLRYFKDEGGDNGTTQNPPPLLKHCRLKEIMPSYHTSHFLSRKKNTLLIASAMLSASILQLKKVRHWLKRSFSRRTTAETGKDAKSQDSSQFIKSLCLWSGGILSMHCKLC